MTKGEGVDRPPWRTLGLVLAAAAVVGGWVAAHISTSVPFDSDEANHANLALRQYQDLAGGHWMDFVRHSYRTGQFPFFHGWMQLPFFTVFGATRFAARVAQVALLIVGCLATAWACYRVGQSTGARRPEDVAFLGGFLFACSPSLGAHAGLCMLETPGAAMTALTLALFAEAVRASGRRATLLHAATAAAALGTYFTKLNYGLWVGPAVFAGYTAWWWKGADRARALKGMAIYAAVSLGWLAVWYSRADQRAAFLGFLHNPAQLVPVVADDPAFSVPGISVDNFTEYFALVAGDYHVHWLLGALLLVAFGVGLRPRKLFAQPVLVAAAACVIWTWLVLSMEFRQYALSRFIAPALPALWIVAAVRVEKLLRGVRHRWALGGAAALLLGAQLWVLPARMEVEAEIDDRNAPVFAFLTESIGAPGSVACLNYTDHTSARTLVWELGTTPGRTYRENDVRAFVSERVFESPDNFHAWMNEPRPWGDAAWQSYVVYFDWDLGHPGAARVVPETARMWREAVRGYGERLEQVASGEFPDTGVTVTVWRDREPPEHMGLKPR